MNGFAPVKIEFELSFFDRDRIAKEDEDAAWWIHGNLSSVARYGEDFGSAVQLYDFAELHSDDRNNLDREVYGRRKFIAARDGAISIFNFGRSMEGIRASLKTCPSLNAIINQERLSAATKMLRDRFPRFDGLRHTVAHAAEFTQTLEVVDEHKSENGFMNSCLFGREFTATFRGQKLSYEISLQSFEHIKKSALMFISAFYQAQNPFRQSVQEFYERMKRS